MKTKLILCLLSLFTLSAMAQHNGPIRRPSSPQHNTQRNNKRNTRHTKPNPSKPTVAAPERVTDANRPQPNPPKPTVTAPDHVTDANRAKPLERCLTVTVNGLSFNMIKVEADGRTVTQDYYIGETEVTQALWTAVMGTNPSYFKKGGRYPVEKVSWDDCITFINRLNLLTGRNFRLPSDVEWEYAACGGNRSRGFKYSGSNYAITVAWYERNSGSCTHKVATLHSNELGLYDMSGNVHEWSAGLVRNSLGSFRKFYGGKLG